MATNEKSYFQTIIERAGFEVRSYSGRGMYGATCIGIDFDGSIGGLIGAVLREVEGAESDEVEEVASAFERMSTDSMGRGTIAYFPELAYWDEGEPEEDDEDEDDGSIAYAARINGVRS